MAGDTPKFGDGLQTRVVTQQTPTPEVKTRHHVVAWILLTLVVGGLIYLGYWIGTKG